TIGFARARGRDSQPAAILAAARAALHHGCLREVHGDGRLGLARSGDHSQPVKLGLLVETEEGLNWDDWRRVYANAERLGFESVWVSDHFLSPWAADRHGLDAWLALAVAAVETSRVVLGPLVSPITFREPAMLARMAESLHDLSQGRFVLGLGLGWNAAEHVAAGISFPPVAERQRRLEDGLHLIRRTMDERRVPLLIGGGGPRSTLPGVAGHADHWNMTTSSVHVYGARRDRPARRCRVI